MRTGQLYGIEEWYVASKRDRSGGRSPVRWWAAAVGLATAALVGLTAVSAPLASAASSSCTHDSVLCPNRIYVGASVDGLMSNTAALDDFTDATGFSPSVAMTFLGFGDQFSTSGLQRLSAAGRLPMVTWEPYRYTDPTTNPYPLASIANGTFDTYLQAQAAKIAAVGAPVAIRFAHEMNSDWYPWSVGVNGNTAARYVAAYRHVHDVLTAAGATNVVWIWCPNVVVGSHTSSALSAMYPGNGYVDWVGLDGYLDTASSTYASTFPATVKILNSVAPSKPIYVAETAVLPGSRRAAMIKDLVSGLLTMPRLVGFTWFNHSTRFDWRIEKDATAAKQLAGSLKNTRFGTAGHVDAVVAAAPAVQRSPGVSGTARVGRTLTGSVGSWRSNSASGTQHVSSRWYRCTSATSTSTCTATTATGSSYTVAKADRHKYLRLAVSAKNSAGKTVAWSTATATVLAVPAKPATPTVEARDKALHVTFPAVPTGASHWKLTINGKAKPLVKVSAKDYWLTGLKNGKHYTLSLTAVDATSTASVSSATTSGTAVPMTAPWKPYVTTSSATVKVKLPSTVPTGATGWQVTVGSVTTTVSTTHASVTVTGLEAGKSVTWKLRAVAGSWAGNASKTPATKGRITVR